MGTARRWPLLCRATALVLSWVFTATTFWASAPPLAFAAPAPKGPLPALIPGFPDNLSQGQGPEAQPQTRRAAQPQADSRGGDPRGGRAGSARAVAGRVQPICECVVEHGLRKFTAYFGYQNDGASAVTIPLGPGNALSRPVPTRPPTLFHPGRTRGPEDAPFRVEFDGDAVVWTVRGPDGRPWSATASRHSPRCGPPPPPPAPSCERVFFGPQRYTRTTGEPNVFEETIEVPTSVAPPHVLRLQNGEPDGRKRVSSGWVALNGEDVVRPEDLNPKIQGFHREVTLTPRTELRVTLASAPGSFLQLSLCGKKPDRTPPTLAVVVPAPDSYAGAPVERVRIEYADAGSGIAPESVAATIDGTALSREGWTVTATAAEGPLVPPVGDGVHELVASVRDRAGNTATARAPFVVDTLPPAVTLDSPADGSYHKTSPVTLGGTVADVDPQVSVRCLREGAEAPATLSGTAFTCALPLAEGQNAVRAEGRDRLSRVGTSEPRTLHLDTKAPEIVFTEPAPGSPVTGTTVDVRGEVKDASPIAWVKVAGREAQVSGTTFTATGIPIGDGAEVSLTAEAEDAAGNQGHAVLPLTVDRQPPAVTIDRPVADAYVRGPVLEVEGTVTDQGDVTVEVNGVPEDPPASLRAPRGYRARVPVTDAASFAITATAIDAAGNRGSAQVDVHVDSAGPAVVIASPASGLVTKETSVLVTGTATDLSPIHSLTVGGQVVPVGPDGSFQVDVPLPAADTTVTLAAEAVDQAGNPGGASIEVVVDRTVPQVTVNGPAKGAVLGESTVTVEGTVVEPHLEAVTVDGQPATVTGQAWQATVGGLAEGSHVFQVRAEDRAGNATALPWPVAIDVSAPGVAITSPAGGATRDATVTVTGTVRDRSLEALTVNGSSATWAGDPASPSGAAFSVSGVALVDQQDNPITVEAKDALQRTGSAVAHVFRDSLAPTIASFTTPPRLVRGEPARAEASVDDGAGTGVASVAFFVNGQEKARLTSPPWRVDLAVPEGVAGGETVTVAVQATDAVGNVSAPVSRGVVVAVEGSEGVVVGSVLADETGRPLPGATVRMASGAGPATATDEAGKYSLPAEGATAVLVAEAEDRTSVERELPVEAGVGTVPVDARLTPLAEAVPVGPDGGTLALGAAATPPSGTVGLAVTVPQDAFAGPVSLRLTPLTPQGLPNLLPLGFSPLVAFDLREDGGASPSLPLPAAVTGLGDGTTPVHLVAYRTSVHAWVVVTPGLVPDAGAVTFALPGLGAYALVSADTGEPAVTVPEASQPLVGVAMAAIPATATSEGVVDPAVLPPTGGQAEGTLVLMSPLPLPSGTVVKAEVTESYTLASEEKASEEKRSHDIVLFRGPTAHAARLVPCTAKDAGATALCAAFPIAPARAFEEGELVEGKVHLDILAGREGVRGKVGGSEAIKVESVGGEASVFVPAQALPRNTAVAVEASELSSYLPSAGGVVALAELVVDFSGQTLALGAELSVRSPGVPAETPLVVARVERVDGIPRLEVVSLARVETDGAGVERLVSEAFPGLAGVTKSGRYVFYRLGAPVGFVTGRVLQLGTGEAGVVVTTANLPFAGVSGTSGAYVVAALPGDVTLTARKPRTSLAGEAGPVTVEAVPAAAAVRDILLEGTATVASIVPANGTKDLPVTQQMEVRSPTALQAATVTLETIRLLRLEGATTTPVAVRLILSGSGRTVAIIPQERLEYEGTYRVEAQGLKDALDADVVVAPAVFTTRKEIPPAFHPERLVFELRPDQPGLVTVSGPGKTEAPPDGTFEAGTEILIINAGNGFVLTLSAGNANEVPATELPATIDDRLMITVTDPFGKTTSFERSQFRNPVTGETAVGPGGGVVTGSGGVEMRIPEGALAKGVAFTMEGLTAEALESAVGDEKVPDLPGAQVGSGIKIEAPTQPTFQKEVDLAFPVPAEALAATGGKPEDAFFHVYRRVETASGAVFFENLDWAKVECPGGASTCADDEKKIVSSSFPWPGLMDVADKMTAALGMGPGGSAAASWIYLMWTYDSQIPGQPTQGTVTGRVVRPTWPEGATVPAYVGVPDVGVWGKDASGGDLVLSPNPLLPPETVAKTDKDGRFTFTDRRFTTGTLEVKARVGSEVYAATAYAVSLTDTKALENPAIAALAKAGVFKQVATVEIVVPPLVEPPPPPAVGINVLRLVDGKRVLTDGLVTRGTGLLFGFKSSRNLEVRGAEVEGQQLEVVPEDLSGTTAGSPLAMDKLGRDTGSADGLYRPERTGRHRVKVAALPVTGGSAQVEWFEATFLVVEGGEANRTTREGEAPGVIAAKTLPRNGAGGVPVSLLPQVVFTEPVRNVPAGVVLEEIKRVGGEIEVVDTIPLSLTGVKPNEDAVKVVGPQDAVVSVMLLPQRGLKYKAEYRLRVTGEIEDLDTTPRSLEPEYASTFTTFGPEDLEAESERFSSAGLALLGDRLYMLETAYAGGVASGQQYGVLRTFDVSDPVEPREVGEKQSINFPPRDVAGDGERLAVVTSSRMYYTYSGGVRELVSTPGNLFLYDVSGDTPVWNGGASLTTSLVEGYANRVAVKGGVAYVAVAKKGIQVVDLATAETAFSASNPSLVFQQMSKPGGGLAPEAVKTIPVSDPAQPYAAALVDLKVADVPWLGEEKRLVFATGNSKALGLVVADTSLLRVVTQRADGQPGGMALEKGTSSLDWGSAIAVGEVETRPLVLLGGIGKLNGAASAGLVAILDLTPMANRPPPGQPTPKPEVVAFVAVPGLPGDILIHGTTAIVSSWTGTGAAGQQGVASLIDLTDPANARVIGTLTGVGSRLALADSNILFSTDRTFLKTTPTDLDGVQSAALDYVTLIKSATPVVVDVEGQSIEPQPVKYRAYFPLDAVETSEVEITDNGVVVQRLNAGLDSTGTGEVSVPTGTKHSPLRARLVINRDSPAGQRPSFAADKLLRAAAFTVEPRGPVEYEMAVDEDPLLVSATNEVLQERLHAQDGVRVQPPTLTWIVAGDGGATVEPTVEASPTGIYVAQFVPAANAGARHWLELRSGAFVLGRSAAIRAVPGQAASAQIDAYVNSLPADGRTTRTLRVFDIRDAAGNVVPEGTAVAWEVLPPLAGEPGDGTNALLPGTLKASVTTVSGGQTTNEYVAGAEPGWVRLRASFSDDLAKEFAIEQAQILLHGKVAAGPIPQIQRLYRIEADSTAGRPPDGTGVGWGATVGLLESGDALSEGAANALFTWPIDPRKRTVGVPAVFATVGRARRDFTVDIGNTVEPSVRLFVEMASQYLLGDRSDNSSYDVSDGQGGIAFSVRPWTTVRVKGGSPGETVHLAVGSHRDPAFLPVNFYQFDSLATIEGQTTTEDLFGKAPAQVGGGVSLSLAESALGLASLRFEETDGVGPRGLTVPGSLAFTPTGEFGVSGYLRIETAVDQTVLTKQGSYGVAVVVRDGSPYLQFSVVNGGDVRRVVSAEPLAVGTWQHFAARLEAQRLTMLLGEEGLIRVGEAAVPPDPTQAPLLIGPSLLGYLDELGLFDFSQGPSFTFDETGQTTVTLTLDDAGEGVATLRSMGRLAGASSAIQSLFGGNYVRFYEPPQTAEEWFEEMLDVDSAARQRFGTFVASALGSCAEGLATGEGGGAVGVACDLALSLATLPFPPAAAAVNVVQGTRDTVVATTNFVDGKDKPQNAVKGSIAILGIVAEKANPISRLGRLGKRALLLMDAIRPAQRALAREALDAIVRNIGKGDEASSAVLRVLGGEAGTRAEQTLLRTLGASDDAAATIAAIERLGGIHQLEDLLGTIDNVLGDLAKNPDIASVVGERLAVRILHSLDEVAQAGVGTTKLGPETIRGMGVVLGYQMKRGWKSTRVVQIWTDLGVLKPSDQVQAFEKMMGWIAQGDAKSIPGWERFVNQATKATLNGNVTKGGYAVLEHLAEDLKWQNIVALEKGLGTPRWRTFFGKTFLVYPRYADVVVRETVLDPQTGRAITREIYREIKNLRVGAEFSKRFAAEVAFDMRSALQLAGDDVAQLSALLGSYQYFLRGSAEEMARVVVGIRGQIDEILGPELSYLANRVRIEALAKPLPI